MTEFRETGRQNLENAQLPDFQFATLEDARRYLRQWRSPGQIVEAIEQQWDTSPATCMSLLQAEVRRSRYSWALRKVSMARKRQMLDQLYFAPEARDATEDAMRHLSVSWAYARGMGVSTDEQREELQRKTRESLDRMREILQNEMRRGGSGSEVVAGLVARTQRQVATPRDA